MNPDIWGPMFWFSLHSITFDYPFHPNDEDKARIRNFFNSLEYILPCSICRVHYSKHIRDSPIELHLGSRIELVRWLIDVHNKVNEQNGKVLMSYDSVIKMYEGIYGKKIILQDNDENSNIIKKKIPVMWNDSKMTMYYKTTNLFKEYMPWITGISVISVILLLCIIIYLVNMNGKKLNIKMKSKISKIR